MNEKYTLEGSFAGCLPEYIKTDYDSYDDAVQDATFIYELTLNQANNLWDSGIIEPNHTTFQIKVYETIVI